MKRWIIFLLLAAATGLSSGCKSDTEAHAQQPQGPRYPQVEFTTVNSTVQRQTIELPGRISAVRDAQVRARVAGILLSRDFQEGSFVEKGQVLFHIDPAPFEAQLAEAQAELAQAEANMINSAATLRRYEPLVKSGVITQQQFEDAQAACKVAKAVKRAAEAKVKTASLNRGYATVTAPISGRIGRALVTEGGLVGQGEATPLAIIRQLDPIYADITEPVSEYLQLRAALGGSMAKNSTEPTPEVTVEIDDVGFIQHGRLLFSDVYVDRTTGQVSLRSEFPNPDYTLLPGMFVRIKIKLGEKKNLVLIPQRAVSHAPDGSGQVFVVNDKGIAQIRAISTGTMFGSLWEVTGGLKAGETIVSNGIDKVRAGMPVRPVESAASVAENTGEKKTVQN